MTDEVLRLIELGRDREAAALGSAVAGRPEGGPMDVLTQLDELDAALRPVGSGIKPEQLDNATPCAEFTVRGVLEHMLAAKAFAAAFRGETPPVAAPAGDDIVAEWQAALDELFAAMRAPGALDRTVEAPFGPVPGETFARFVVLDGVVHGWDLATSTGQDYAPSDALVADVDAFARGAVDNLRDGRTFADAKEAPAGASPVERLAAYTGRTV